jgi:hypothetical protein
VPGAPSASPLSRATDQIWPSFWSVAGLLRERFYRDFAWRCMNVRRLRARLSTLRPNSHKDQMRRSDSSIQASIRVDVFHVVVVYPPNTAKVSDGANTQTTARMVFIPAATSIDALGPTSVGVMGRAGADRPPWLGSVELVM